MESQQSNVSFGAIANVASGEVEADPVAALRQNRYQTANDLDEAAGKLCEIVASGGMLLDSGVKFASLLRTAIKAKELKLKCGPFA